MKRLYRSTENKIIAGVIGGIGEYMNVDPVLLRIFWVAITIFTGIIPGILVYILAIIIIPNPPQTQQTENTTIPEAETN